MYYGLFTLIPALFISGPREGKAIIQLLSLLNDVHSLEARIEFVELLSYEWGKSYIVNGDTNIIKAVAERSIFLL